MAPLTDAVLPQGSLILVTGVNGYVGSHVVNQFLQHGYNVRGTVRDAKKHAWIASYFEKQYGAGKFELVEVKDLANLEAMKKVLEGCAGFAATASDVSLSPDPNVVVVQAVELTKTALEAAAATPSVKRFVQTSSSVAAGPPGPEVSSVVDLSTDSWDTVHSKRAWAPPPYEADRIFAVYCASKTQQEQEAWKFVQERKPGFVLNAVLPDFVCGKILSVENQGFPSSVGFLKAIWDGDIEKALMLPPQYQIDAEDQARLHVAAMLHPDAQGERIFGFAYPKSTSKILQHLRKLYPERTFADDPPNEAESRANILPRPRAEELLKWVKGSGWTSFEQSVKQCCDDFP